jgi:hypothetical protein
MITRRKLLVLSTASLGLSGCGGAGGEEQTTTVPSTQPLNQAQPNNTADTNRSAASTFTRGAGAILPTDAERNALFSDGGGMVASAGAAVGAVTLPVRLDLSVTHGKYLPPVGDQGPAGTCVAWAYGYGALTFLACKSADVSAAVPSNQVSAMDLYTTFVPALGHCGLEGIAIGHAGFTTMLRESSYGSEADLPYPQASTTTPNQLMQLCQTGGTKVERFRLSMAKPLVNRFSADGDLAVKQELVAGRVVPFAIRIGIPHTNDRFLGHRGSSVLADWDTPGEAAHAMLIVGYDDTLRAFKVMNSWGTDWGDRGFAWIAYAAFAKHNAYGHMMDQAYRLDNLQAPAAELAVTQLKLYRYYDQYQRLIYYFAFALNDVCTITHTAYSYEGSEPYASEWMPYEMRNTKGGALWFINPSYSRNAQRYVLWLAGVKRDGSPFRMAYYSEVVY